MKTLLLLMLSLVLGPLLPTGAAAATGGDSLLVIADLEIEAPPHAPGDPVSLVLWAVNPTGEPETLVFPDSRIADYTVDGVYRWSDDKAFTDASVEIELMPGERRLLMHFEHTPDDYPLTPGPHAITGIIPGYASTDRVLVVSEDPDPGSFALEGMVSPERAALGEPVAFELTVTNVGDSTASFGVDGCPVHYNLDGRFAPRWACAEFWMEVSLAPGESRTFSAADDPRLVHPAGLYPLGPGPHRAVLGIPDVGRAVVPFEVTGPDPNLAYLSGRMTHRNGEPIREGTVRITRLPDPSDPSVPPDVGNHETALGKAGYFFLGDISPGSFRLQVEAEGTTLWWPGVDNPARSDSIRIGGGVYREHLDMVFPAGPPPHPLPRFVGAVYDGDDPEARVPLAGVRVVAVPAYPSPEDSTGIGLPPDEIGGGAGTVFTAFTGDDGSFLLPVPTGLYRLIAGKEGDRRYQYWNRAATWDTADLVGISPDGPQFFHTFFLDRSEGGASAFLGGRVLAFDPTRDGPPKPVTGADVFAWRLIPGDPREIDRTKTDDQGNYGIRVLPGTPYRVQVRAEGFQEQYYPDHAGADGADGVDVAPGRRTEGVDFVLQPLAPPASEGTVVGRVFRARPGRGCPDRSGCFEPAAGALVRVEAAYPTFAPYVRTTHADGEGFFRVGGLAAAPDGGLSYYVSAEIPNFPRAYYPGGVPFDRAEPLPVFPNQPTDAGRLLLRQAPPPLPGFIAGRVADPAGAPVAHARVRAYLEPTEPRGPVLAVRTNRDGRFLFTDVPEGALPVIAADAEGYVPAYAPSVYRWESARRVEPSAAPDARSVEPVIVTLRPAPTDGPFIQAGRVRLGDEASDEDSTRTLADARSLGLLHHRHNLPGAFFYLGSPLQASPIDIPISGGATGDNGSVILTGLTEGVYVAYADRPGFPTTSFTGPDGFPVAIHLDDSTPAVLADIHLGTPPREGEGNRLAPMVTELRNSPNPFRPRTTIRFELHETAPVRVQIFDDRGRLVRDLLDGSTLTPGPQSVDWDGTDTRGRRVGSGMYFYRVLAGAQSISKKMLLLP